MRSRLVPAALALAFLAACSGGGDPPAPLGDSQMKPRFAPESTASTAPAGAADPGTTTPSAVTPSTQPATVVTTAPAPERAVSSTTDRVGDVVAGVERPPRWVDLAGGTVAVLGDTVELRVTFADAVAERGDGVHTVNAAAFFDVDGNGLIDYEVWANLAKGGWGGAYYDDVDGGARFNERSDVAIATEGRDLVLTFPLRHVRGQRAFRWGLALEWARYETLGTVASARDEAPDGDGAVRHPG